MHIVAYEPLFRWEPVSEMAGSCSCFGRDRVLPRNRFVGVSTAVVKRIETRFRGYRAILHLPCRVRSESLASLGPHGPLKQQEPTRGGKAAALTQPRCVSRKTPQSLREKPQSALGLAFVTASQNSGNSQNPQNNPCLPEKMSGRWLPLVHPSQALFTSFFTKE